jgi:hypothetical protein
MVGASSSCALPAAGAHDTVMHHSSPASACCRRCVGVTSAPQPSQTQLPPGAVKPAVCLFVVVLCAVHSMFVAFFILLSLCAAPIRVWRLDSGDYATVASAVVEAWEQRCQQREAAGLPPLPRPLLMHSNLSSVEEVQEVGRCHGCWSRLLPPHLCALHVACLHRVWQPATDCTANILHGMHGYAPCTTPEYTTCCASTHLPGAEPPGPHPTRFPRLWRLDRWLPAI